MWISVWISEGWAVGKSGITRCIVHKDIHQTVDSPGFSTSENVDNPTVHSGKMGKNTILYIVDGYKTAYKI